MANILIIEDEKNIAELERDYLESKGYNVTLAFDGETGLNILYSNSFDLIILDIMIPKIDGITILEEVRKEHNMPILMVSAKRDESAKIKCFELGADDYVMKPFSPRELLARVTAHLSRYDNLVNGNKAKNIIVINDLIIDKNLQEVTLGGEKINLTSKELAVLIYLAERPNQVISKEELFENVWSMEPYGNIATVTVHIKKIREKIEPVGSTCKYIETIWGRGYSLKK